MNKKRVIKINEAKFNKLVKKMVSESVKRILKETNIFGNNDADSILAQMGADDIYNDDVQDYLVQNGRIGNQKNQDVFIWIIKTSNKVFCSNKNFNSETRAMFDCTKYLEAISNTKDKYAGYVIRYSVDDIGGIDESTLDYYDYSTQEWDD